MKYTITFAPEAKEGLAKLKRSEPASFKKPVKGLQIALGVSYGLCAILVIVAIALLLVKMTFDQGSIASIIVIIVVALLHVALYVLSALFGGFKPAFKKEAAPSVE